MYRRLAFAVACASAITCASAAEVSFESAATRTHLIELYTSQGCSSCPPAESWLSKLKGNPRLWRDFVPVAFHVDYWDRLGWRDPFASRQWTARQHAYAARWRSGSVYTPGFMLNGREWANDATPTASSEAPGVLRVTLRNHDQVNARFSPQADSNGAYDVHIALLGGELVVDVKGGENSGRKLQHDFVVLALASAALNGDRTELRLPHTSVTPKALAAWVTLRDRSEPLQATGGWLH